VFNDEDMRQCLLYASNTPNARLIGKFEIITYS
jgi:hypothetical protein